VSPVEGDAGVANGAGAIRFLTAVSTIEAVRHVRLAIESLRAFGGALSACPVWVFFRADAQCDPADIERACAGLEDVQLLTLASDAGARPYPFQDKVQACAQAEAMAEPAVRSLIWLSAGCLIVSPPTLFDLVPPVSAAFRTVHHRNIGSLAHEPLDAFWVGVYRATGSGDAPYTIESFADRCEIRPYFNTHCFSIDPARGLCRAWATRFEEIVADRSFQEGPCHDPLYRIFLHQAVLSALVAKELAREEIRLLPPEYSYPLHMHDQVPLDRRARTLNDLVCAAYEGAIPTEGIAIEEPLRSWLMARATNREERSTA
jgi:hypothetical protein